MVVPGIASYCGTKAMVSAFGTGINYELRDKNVDVLVWEAGAAKTGLGGDEQDPPAAICAPVPDMIESCLTDLGREVVTTGVFKHVLFSLPSFPISLIGRTIATKVR